MDVGKVSKSTEGKWRKEKKNDTKEELGDKGKIGAEGTTKLDIPF